MLYGQELLGAAKYEGFAIKYLPAGRCGKTFSKEFGPSQTVLRSWAMQTTHPVVATNGLWRGGAHDYSGANTLTEGLKELEKFAKIASDFPEQAFYFNIFTEHKLKTSYLQHVFSKQWEIVKYLKNIVLVNNPMSGGDLAKPGAFGIPVDRLLNEIHGNWKPNTTGMAPFMWACDGLPAQDCNIQSFKNYWNRASIIWLWMQQYNCKTKVDETTPIPERKVKPIAKQVTSLEYLIPDKGNTKLQNDSLEKSHADQHGSVPVGREQKPLIISPVDAEKIDYIASNGKLVHSLKRQGNYTDGRPIYRAEDWGFEIQEKAFTVSGNKIVDVVAVRGNKRTKLGKLNPAFRENAYRVKLTVNLLKNFALTYGLSGKKLAKFLKDNRISIESVFDDEIPVNPDWV